MDDLDTKEIEELIAKVKNDDFIKVDRELINVDTFSKICSTMKPQIMYDFESKAEECNRILDKLNDGMYTCDEKPEIHKTENQSDLSTIINEQRYSISYNTVFQQHDSKENFIVCKSERLESILQQLNINIVDEAKESEENTDNGSKNIVRRYDTIQEAINNASPGQSIIIDEGKYNESIIIDKTVELKALNITDKKEPKNVEIIAESGDCITLRANCGHIEGLRIFCDTPGNTFCAKTNSGLLEIENCHLASESAGCFHVDENAKITIKDSELCTKYSLSSLQPRSHAVIMDCTFTQPATKEEILHPFISIDPNATCIIIDCTIESMISFLPYSKGMLLRCNISTKGKFIKGEGNGICIKEGAEPLIKNCKIDNCAEAGIRFDPKSKGVIDDCIITGNTNFGVLSLSAEQFLITNSHIEKNKEYGLRVNNSKGEIANTEIKENNKSGLLIEDGSEIKLKLCDVIDHYFAAAIFIRECQEKRKRIAKFSVIDSNVSNNISGIIISGNCESFISKSSIVYNSQYGLIVERDSKVEINECDISCNGLFQLVSPKMPANYNPENQAAPSPDIVPSYAEITAKGTKFGPYGLHCIVLSGKSISNFNQKCTFGNNQLDSMNVRKKTSEIDIAMCDKEIESYENDIKAGKATPDIQQKKKRSEDRRKKINALCNKLDDLIKKSGKASDQEILKKYQVLKVSSFIILEGNARCSVDNGDFRTNIEFIEAKEMSKLFVTNSSFFKDYLASIRLKNNASLDLRNSVFNNSKTGVALLGKASAYIHGNKFINSSGCSITCNDENNGGWNLNMEKNQLTLGIGQMISMTGKGEAKFTENKFIGQNTGNDGNSAHKSGGADVALLLNNVLNCMIEKNVFKNFQRGAVEAVQSTVKIIGNNLIEMHKFPLLFKNSNIEIINNNIINDNTKPQNAISIQDGCTGSITGNYCRSNSPRFLEVMGQSSKVREGDNNIVRP